MIDIFETAQIQNPADLIMGEGPIPIDVVRGLNKIGELSRRVLHTCQKYEEETSKLETICDRRDIHEPASLDCDAHRLDLVNLIGEQAVLELDHRIRTARLEEFVHNYPRI